MIQYLSEEFAREWLGEERESLQGKSHDIFLKAQALTGDVFREVKGRRTLRFELGGKTWFIKHHKGVGWGEILKNLVSFRLPILGAKNEYLAIQALTELGVPTMTAAAYAERGWNHAQRESFLITEELKPVISLEDVCRNWPQQRPPFVFKQRLLLEVARMARLMHSNGICHRDFYLCHFLLHCQSDGSIDTQACPQLSLIDLHRALIKPAFMQRWIKKDIAGLYFSARDIGLTRTDLFRFIKAYSGKPLRQALSEQSAFWSVMQKKADRVWRRDLRKFDARLRKEVCFNSTRVERLQTASQLALINRALWQPSMQALLDDTDQLVASGSMLKDGDSTTVVKIDLAGQQWVVKRYNLKSVGYALSRLLRPSRAWHCWINAFRLQQAGIDTPTPLLMLEKRWGPLRRQAYYVCAHVEGPDAMELMLPEQPGSARWRQVSAMFDELFRRLRQQRLIHGDLKATNFIVADADSAEAKLVVLDLDATRIEHNSARFIKYHQRDLLRYRTNWIRAGKLPAE